MLPDMYGSAARAQARQDDLLREAERERLATIARQTATAYGNRRWRLWRRADRGSTPLPVTGQAGGIGAAVPPRPLVREPAV